MRYKYSKFNMVGSSQFIHIYRAFERLVATFRSFPAELGKTALPERLEKLRLLNAKARCFRREIHFTKCIF